jgi:hypothetical protein
LDFWILGLLAYRNFAADVWHRKERSVRFKQGILSKFGPVQSTQLKACHFMGRKNGMDGGRQMVAD